MTIIHFMHCAFGYARTISLLYNYLSSIEVELEK